MSPIISEPKGSGGGPQPVAAKAFAFDTPGIVLTGIEAFTLPAGTAFLPYSGYNSIAESFDGTTPVLHLGVLGDLTRYDSDILGAALDLAVAADNTSVPGAAAPTKSQFNTLSVVLTQAVTFTLMIDDGSGGDPGNTAGSGLLAFATQLLGFAA